MWNWLKEAFARTLEPRYQAPQTRAPRKTTMTKADYNMQIAMRAKLLSRQGITSAVHVAMAKAQLDNENKANGITVLGASFVGCAPVDQFKGDGDAAAEAGGYDKI